MLECLCLNLMRIIMSFRNGEAEAVGGDEVPEVVDDLIALFP